MVTKYHEIFDFHDISLIVWIIISYIFEDF